MYCGNYKAMMKGSGVAFYPLQVTMLNITEQCRRMQIGMEITVLTYQPITYSLFDQSINPEVFQQKPFRSKLVQALHK